MSTLVQRPKRPVVTGVACGYGALGPEMRWNARLYATMGRRGPQLALRVVFLAAAFFEADFLAVLFFAAGFLAADFFAVDFFAVDFRVGSASESSAPVSSPRADFAASTLRCSAASRSTTSPPVLRGCGAALISPPSILVFTRVSTAWR